LRLSGYRTPIHASPFPADRDGLSRASSPGSIKIRVHPLVSFTLLRSSSCVGLPVVSPRRAPSLGFRARFAVSASESTCTAGVPGQPTFRPRRFARPRRFPPRITSWVCFTPLPRPGFSLQGFPPAIQPGRLSTIVPPRCWHRDPAGGLAAGARSRHVTLEALLRVAIRSDR